MDFGQQYVAVLAVMALLAAALWWLRRRGYAAVPRAPRRGRRLEAIERLALSPQHTLHLVRIGEAVVLLACSPGGCAVVREVAPEAGSLS